MSYDNLKPGVYLGRIVDWGVQEVATSKTLKAVIKFSFKDADGGQKNITWDGFFLKKDGSPNEKTVKTLQTCGFIGKAVSDLTAATALDTTKELSLDIIKDGEYWRVEWVNDPSQGMANKVTDVKKIKGYDLRKVDALFASSIPKDKKVRNYADDVVNPTPAVDNSEPLPF